VVRLITEARRDERRTLFGEFSQIVRDEPVGDQDNPMSSMPININMSEPPLDRAEGVREGAAGNAEEDSTREVLQAELDKESEDLYDDWD